MSRRIGSKASAKASLRIEIAACERMENHYREKLARIKKLNYHWLEEGCISSINHYIGRRKFFIKKLTEHQLKEFDSG